MAFETRSIGQVALETTRIIVRHNVDEAERLLKPDPVTTAWKNQLMGQRMAEDASKPDYGDPHPTPGASKVPEVVRGMFLHSRI